MLATLAAVGITVYGVLCPSLPIAFIVPVALYCLVIATMCAKCVLRAPELFPTWGRWVSILGALSFFLSDGTLSITMFKSKFHGSGLMVMVTYYVGQLCIGLSACDFVLSSGALQPLTGSKYEALVDADQPPSQQQQPSQSQQPWADVGVDNKL